MKIDLSPKIWNKNFAGTERVSNFFLKVYSLTEAEQLELLLTIHRFAQEKLPASKDIGLIIRKANMGTCGTDSKKMQFKEIKDKRFKK